jgi:tRNA G18 (ribose-2'-O)-methylase SpoU
MQDQEKYHLETRASKTACVCADCGAFYFLEDPVGFKHLRRCKYKKHGDQNKPLDERFTSWQYNVIDEYKPLSVENIKEKMKETQLPAAVFMSQLSGDFNIGNIIRTSNAYNLSKVYYYGKKHYDKRGAEGTYHYTDVVYLSSIDEVRALKDKYHFVAIENNVPGKIAQNINKYCWKENSLILLGEEGSGIPGEIISLCDDLVEIKNFGSVRSLNVGTAAAIAIDKLSFQFRKE